MSRLDRLENHSIHLIREAVSTQRKLGMLWSIGKDSTVLLHLLRKAYCGSIPIPLIHVDTSYKIPEMITFRDKMATELGFELLIARNDQAIRERQTYPAGLSRTECCRLLKTAPLQSLFLPHSRLYRLEQGVQVPLSLDEPFSALLLGIRGDEEGSRSKERYFSMRLTPRADEQTRQSWNIEEQPPEIWNFYTLTPDSVESGERSIRVHPLLDWTELDIWEYIERESIAVSALYFDRGEGIRYRSLGCAPCTGSIRSTAKSVSEIVAELRDGAQSRRSERSGRAQDSEDGGGLETLRRGGYM